MPSGRRWCPYGDDRDGTRRCEELVLRDVLGFRTAEVADMLDTGEAAVKRATVGGGFRPPTLAGDAIAAITWFGDTGVFRHFGPPRTLPNL
jgi:hypothetical protein